MAPFKFNKNKQLLPASHVVTESWQLDVRMRTARKANGSLLDKQVALTANVETLGSSNDGTTPEGQSPR